MIGGRNRPLTRYKVEVFKAKPQRRFPMPTDSEIHVKDDDVFFGYGYPNHLVGKYFDLWFMPDRDEDHENFVTFGRILSITRVKGGHCYITKLGVFTVSYMDVEEPINKVPRFVIQPRRLT